MTSRRSSGLRKGTLLYRAGCLAAGTWVYFALPSWPLVTTEADRRSAVVALAGVDATMLGFLVTATALLYAVANTRLVQNLMRTKHFNRIVADLFVTAGAFLAALCVAVGSAFLAGTGSDGQTLLETGMRMALAMNIAAVLMLLPVAVGLWQLLMALEPDGRALQ